jgi:neutral ceramidase
MIEVEHMIHIGYHQALITPALPGLPLEGYEHRFIYDGRPTGILDDLYLKVLSITDPCTEQLLITVDLCILTNEYLLQVRQLIRENFGIPEGNVCICVSHTHSGPITTNPWDEIGSGDETSSIYDRFGKESEQYLQMLKETIIRTIGYARSAPVPAECFYTTARTTLGFNRRGRGEDGATVNCFSLWERDAAVLDGPVEDRIPVLIFEVLDDPRYDSYLVPRDLKRIVLFSVALHPVVMGKHSTLISADYPGAACEAIEQNLGAGTRAMFTLGACGDTEPYLATQQNPEAVRIIGTAAGYAVLAAYAARTPVETESIHSASCILPAKQPDDVPVALSVLHIGQAAIACAGAECFTQASLDLLAAAPSPYTLFATNTNGWAGYLPTAQAYQEGGYEVAPGRTDVDEHRLEAVTDALVSMLNMQTG